MIIARIVNPSIFIGKESGKIVEVAEKFEIEIPRLFINEYEYEVATTTEAAFDVVYQVGSTTTIITGLFVNFSLKQLWIQKNVMQVIVQLKVFK